MKHLIQLNSMHDGEKEGLILHDGVKEKLARDRSSNLQSTQRHFNITRGGNEDVGHAFHRGCPSPTVMSLLMHTDWGGGRTGQGGERGETLNREVPDMNGLSC